MKTHTHRPTARRVPRFFVINPVLDRRLEARFESSENIVIRFEEEGRVCPAVGLDMGRQGMRLQTMDRLNVGSRAQIVFPNSADSIRCFGRVVWSKPLDEGGFESGIVVVEWVGIVEGTDSWRKYQGRRLKEDRRDNSR